MIQYQEAAKATPPTDRADVQQAREAVAQALAGVSKAALGGLRSLGKPPAQGAEVTAAVSFLLGAKKKADWRDAQRMLASPAKFLADLQSFDATRIPAACLRSAEAIVQQPWFNFETMATKSTAAAQLANW